MLFVQIPLTPCQFRKTCLRATATAERRIKSLEFCFSRVGGERLFRKHPVIFSVPDPDISFMVCLSSEERCFLDAKMALVTNAARVPLKPSWGNFMGCWSVWLTHRTAQLPGPELVSAWRRHPHRLQSELHSCPPPLWLPAS